MAVRTCWCRLCQYLGAGNATVNVCFAADAVSITGEVSWYASKADSGNDLRRGFCPKCGTPLFSICEQRPHLIFIRAGALDDSSIARPEATIWVTQAPAWACIDPNIPTHDAQPPPVS
jgi:hypothetical protein